MLLFLFIIGSCFASFANVLIYRIPKNISFYKGRSYCEFCHRKLCWYDLIPIVSYLLLKGKCRYCKSHISITHLLFECLGGFLILLCEYRFGYTLEMFLVFFIVMILLVIAVIDFKTMSIYLSTLLILFFLAIGYSCLNEVSIDEMVYGSLGISSLMIIVNLFVPTSFGFGDIELMFISGMFLGWQKNIVAFCIAVITGGIYASYLMCNKKTTKQKHIAFAPYLALGIILSLFYGNVIISWYGY